MANTYYAYSFKYGANGALWLAPPSLLRTLKANNAWSQNQYYQNQTEKQTSYKLMSPDIVIK